MVKNYKIKAAVPGYISTLQFLIFSLKKRAAFVMPINKIIFLFFFFAGLLFLSCNPSEPEIAPAGLEFKAEDASCTEAWLTLKAGNITGAKVFREDSLIYSFNTNSIDTTLFDEGLLPNQIYKYHTVIQPSNNSRVVTKELTLQTMDTTSHNFTWQTFTFGGDAGSSALNDVAIIDENNIWAVGEIYLKDSLGTPDPHAYNAVHWDGQTWKLFKLQFFTFCGQSYTSSYPAKAIYAFDSENIIISSNSQLTYLRNEKQIRTECVSVSVNKIWGTSSSDLYVVGNNGGIAHYDGSKWTKIESGTTTNINDIWGFPDPVTQEEKIFCAVSFVFEPGDQKILTIKNNTVDSLKWDTGRRLHTIWGNNHYYLYTGGGGIFENKRGYWNEIKEVPLYYSRKIRGTASNNIFVCGDFGLIAHYNGLNWKTFNQFYMYGIYSSVAVKNNLVVAVGLKGNQAVITMGLRN